MCVVCVCVVSVCVCVCVCVLSVCLHVYVCVVCVPYAYLNGCGILCLQQWLAMHGHAIRIELGI